MVTHVAIHVAPLILCRPNGCTEHRKNDIPPSWILRTVACDYMYCVYAHIYYTYDIFYSKTIVVYVIVVARVYFIIIVPARAPLRR